MRKVYKNNRVTSAYEDLHDELLKLALAKVGQRYTALVDPW